MLHRIILTLGFFLLGLPALAGGYHEPPTPPPTPPPPAATQTLAQTVQGGAGGQGGQGGAAASKARSASQSVANANANSASRATAANANRNAASISGNALGSTNTIDARSAPAVVLPSIGGGGMDCPIVGFGVGGSGIGGGGGIGPTWISSDCNKRKLAEMLDHMGFRDAAIALLENEFPEVQKAMAATVMHEAPAPEGKLNPPRDYCNARPGWTRVQLLARYGAECR